MVSVTSGCNVSKKALIVGALCLFLSLTFAAPTRARAMDETILDEATLLHLEQQAASAEFKEQCYLYTEILHSLTEIAGKQLADGQDDQAAVTFRHIDSIAAKVQMAMAKDAKRLKNAEMIMEHTTRRLTDMLHITSGDQHTALQATVTRVNAVQTLLLSQVFAK